MYLLNSIECMYVHGILEWAFLEILCTQIIKFAYIHEIKSYLLI